MYGYTSNNNQSNAGICTHMYRGWDVVAVTGIIRTSNRFGYPLISQQQAKGNEGFKKHSNINSQTQRCGWLKLNQSDLGV